MAIIHHFDWKTFNTNNNICLCPPHQTRHNLTRPDSLPSAAAAPAGRRSASGPWPGRCSCRPGCAPPPGASGTPWCPRTEHRIRSTYTGLEISQSLKYWKYFIASDKENNSSVGKIIWCSQCILTIIEESLVVRLRRDGPVLVLLVGVVVVWTDCSGLHLLLPPVVLLRVQQILASLHHVGQPGWAALKIFYSLNYFLKIF